MIVGGFFGLLLIAVWIYAIFDVISSDEAFVRNLPKVLWLLLVVVVPTVGAVAWFVLGRPEGAALRPGDPRHRPKPRSVAPSRPSPRAVGPEDSPEFLAQIDERARRLQQWEDDLTEREKDLRRRREGESED